MSKEVEDVFQILWPFQKTRTLFRKILVPISNENYTSNYFMKFNVYVLSFLFQVTIKKTLQDFKRTHQDNWQEHKLRFSDDQMAVLTDLLVSPSYYA